MSNNEIALRHLALLGEMVQGLAKKGPITPDALRAAVPPQAFWDATELVGLIPSVLWDETGALSDFSDLDKIPMTHINPLCGSSCGSFVGDPARKRLLLGICLCLPRCNRNGIVPKAMRLPMGDLENAMEELVRKADLIAEASISVVFGKQEKGDLLKWLGQWQFAADEEEAEAFAETPLDTGIVAEYRRAFPNKFAGSIPFTQFLYSRGCFPPFEPEVRSRTRYRSKREFVPQEKGGYGGLNLGDGFRWGRNVDWDVLGCLLNHVLRARCPEIIKESPEEVGHAGLPDGPSAKAIKMAGTWLCDRDVGRDDGIIITSQRVVLGNALEKDDSWVSHWQEPVGLEGFAGRYRGHPLWHSPFREPVVVAIDLTGLRILKVDPCVKEGRWCGTPVVSEVRTEQHIQEMKEKGPHLPEQDRADHYCKVTVDIFFDVDHEALKAEAVSQHSTCFCISAAAPQDPIEGG